MRFSRRSLPIARPFGEHIALRQNLSKNPSVSTFVLWKKLIVKRARFSAWVKSGIKGTLSSLFKILGGNAICCSAVLFRFVWKWVAAMNSTSRAQPTPNFRSGIDNRLSSSVNRGCAGKKRNDHQLRDWKFYQRLLSNFFTVMLRSHIERLPCTSSFPPLLYRLFRPDSIHDVLRLS